MPRFDRTIARSYVHRSALSEVFLTDTVSSAPDTYYVWGQFPRQHAYYGDQLARPAHYDPVLVLEFARQAALAVAHAHFDVPFDHKFILTHQRLTITRPELLLVGTEPASVHALVRTRDRREYEGVVTGLDYALEVRLGHEVVATAELGLRFRSTASYEALRRKARGGQVPTSTAVLAPDHSGEPVAAYLVDRFNPANVILVDARVNGPEVTARLRPPYAHPSMFDHAQDHLPGMVLIEAARQLALFASGVAFGLAPMRLSVLGVHAAYAAFGELEPQTVLAASVGLSTPASPGSPGSVSRQADPLPLPLQVDVRVLQDDQAISQIAVTVATTAW